METDKPIKSERVYRFVEEYAKDRNGTQAAIRAGYSLKTAGEQAARLLADDRIRKLVQERCGDVASKVEFDAMKVLQQWVLIATADPAKISRVRHINCRHCWGENHDYQWKAREYAEAMDQAGRMGTPPPSCSGGFGFVSNREPNPACPECHGEGERDVYFEDMDKLGPAERRLIAAVKTTKDGIEVKMRDQGDALAKIAQYVGMLRDRVELTGKDGAPVAVAAIPVELPVDPAQLSTLYAKLLG